MRGPGLRNSPQARRNPQRGPRTRSRQRRPRAGTAATTAGSALGGERALDRILRTVKTRHDGVGVKERKYMRERCQCSEVIKKSTSCQTTRQTDTDVHCAPHTLNSSRSHKYKIFLTEESQETRCGRSVQVNGDGVIAVEKSRHLVNLLLDKLVL